MSPDVYPYYKRRNDGEKIMRRNQTVDNRFVLLSLRFVQRKVREIFV